MAGVLFFCFSAEDTSRQVPIAAARIGLFPILVEGGWLRNRDSDPHGQYAVHGKAEGV